MLISAPYCARFEGRLLDYLLVALGLGFVLILPLVPWFWSPCPGASPWLLVCLLSGPVLGTIAAFRLRYQGRYLYSSRELPDLTGEPRRVAEDVLGRAGLKPLAIRVAPLGSFNAMVQGIRNCAVVVDRRVSESVSAAEFGALIGHEAGHVKNGGLLLRLAVVSVAFACIGTLAVFAGMPLLDGFPFFLAGLLCLTALIAQWQEIVCDRFAARLTSSRDVARLLTKLQDDQPASVSRIANDRRFLPFLSHPPLAVRLAALEEADARAMTSYRRRWLAALLVFLVIPAGILLAKRLFGVAAYYMPIEVTVVCFSLPVVFVLGRITTGIMLQRASSAHSGASRGGFSRGRWIRWSTLGTGAALVACLVLMNLLHSPPGWLAAVFLVSLCGFALLVLIGGMTGAFRSGILQLPRRLRKVIIEAQAALEEGQPEEALAILERAPPRHRRHPWFIVTRGASMTFLGDHDAVIEALEPVMQRERTFTYGAFILAVAKFLRGDLEEAEKLTARLIEMASGDASGWHFAGVISLEVGNLEEAEQRFQQAERLKERNASALAGRALVALERGARAKEAEEQVATARAMEPQSPWVLMASARLSQETGESKRAREELQLSLRKLEERGMRGWVAYFEKLGRRWKILEEEREE